MSAIGFVYALLWAHLSLPALLAGPLLLALGSRVSAAFERIHSSVLDWSLFRVRSGIVLAPLRLRFIGPLYAVVLLAALPLAALIEELVFRVGSHGLLRGVLWGALAFGFAHLSSFLSVRACLYVSLIGLLFVGVYDAWGLFVVWTLHFSYNLSVLACMGARGMIRQWPSLRAISKPNAVPR